MKTIPARNEHVAISVQSRNSKCAVKECAVNARAVNSCTVNITKSSARRVSDPVRAERGAGRTVALGFRPAYRSWYMSRRYR